MHRASPQIIQADLTLLGTQFVPRVQVVVEAGRITQVGTLGLTPTQRLTGQALLPGMVNVHSHAFQVGLRGKAELFPKQAGSFWSWREEMYRLVESLDAATFKELCLRAYREMLAAGITTVGEFHYLHHNDTCRGFAFDELVLEAAREAGIRLVLIQTYYKTGAVNRPLTGGQCRFATPSLDEYWKQFERLQGLLDPATQSLAVAAHSIRAVPLDDLRELARGARDRGVPMHMHVEEQPKEIEECKSAYGKSPMRMVLEHVQPGSWFTAIHCTHSDPADLREYIATGAGICLCPTTEGNLGDGIPDARSMWNQGAPLCLGSDSNLRIDMFEEMRWLEFGQRLRFGTRGVITGEDGTTGGGLWSCATTNGARALGQSLGKIEPGSTADLLAISLSRPVFAAHEVDSSPNPLALGATAPSVGRPCVRGNWVEDA